ncbi:MAG: DUF86 domain-containing protein [Cyclobacteriaceae bacterium]|nr:DUF86 domain-containing protein [Cyclobacteriaceae bacterium]
MKERPVLLYLLDMQNAIQRILAYTENLTYEQFCNNFMVVDAVIRNFEVLGEAAKHIPKNVKDFNTDVPWKNMYAMRNIVIHQYFGIDHELIWDIIQNHLSQNLTDLNTLINVLKNEK